MTSDAPLVLDARADLDGAVARAAGALGRSGIVVLPTDTLYGLGADAFDTVACARVFAAKERPRSMPLPVLVRSPKQLVGLVGEVDPRAERLMAAYWPGALTLVVRALPDLAWDLGETAGSVAVRMPDDDVALALIAAVGPLAVTSANRSGRPPATTVTGAVEQLGGEVDVYLDAGSRGEAVASTIVDLTGSEVRALRVGALDPDDVVAVAEGRLDPFEAAARVVHRAAE
jgi:tRNA threonylcarbamoyl adenosine modification protein (Sua5/YciO/YrdC/YwlC family)